MQENPYAAPTAQPHAPGLIASPGEGPREWTVGQVLGVGWKAVKEQPVPLVGGTLLVTVVQYAVQALLQFLVVGDAAESGNLVRTMAGMGVILPVYMVMGIYFVIGQLRVALMAARGQPVEIAMYFSGYDRLVIGVVLGIVVYLGMLVGFLLFIIPGVIVALGWSLAFFNFVDADTSVSESLSESWEQTKGQRGKIFLFYLAALGVVLLGMLALYIGIFLAIPVIMVASAEMYLCITGRSRVPAGAAG